MSDSQTRAVDSVGEDAGARARVYQLLGVLLTAAPTRDTLDALAQLGGEDHADTRFSALLDELAAAAAGARPETLQTEYFNLFIGLGRGELMPYASWYLQGALMERILADLRNDLRRLGFERRTEVHEPEDHAGAVCQTMGMIITDPGLSLEQSAFFDRYVGAWLGRFFEDLENAESAEFYTVVGRLGRHFIDIEADYLSLPE